jgi:hypothetical protein
MKLFGIGLLFTTLALAQSPADRAAVENVIHSLRTAEPVSALFTADADSDLDRLRMIEASMTKEAHEPWSEVGPVALVINSVRFLSPDIALVDASETQIGVHFSKGVPVVFALKRENSQWKIAYLRVMADNQVIRRPPVAQ